MFSKNVLKIVPTHVYKFCFFNTSNTYRVFGNYFPPRWKPLVDARVGNSRRLLSEVFERKADYLILTTSSKRNFSLIASRTEKNTWNIFKITFFVETITFLRFFRAAYLRGGPRTTFADQGPSKTVAFFWIPSKMFMSGTWNFRIIEKNIKAIFREYFSSLREDSGKIFKLMTFRSEPRTTYCTTNHQQEIVSLSQKKERPETNNSLY